MLIFTGVPSAWNGHCIAQVNDDDTHVGIIIFLFKYIYNSNQSAYQFLLFC